MNLKIANYWLTQIEQVILQFKDQHMQNQEREVKIINLVQSFCQYSTTHRSDALARREEGYYTGFSREHTILREIFSELDTADMVNIQIQDFVSLLEICRIKREKSRQLEAVLPIQKMIKLNQQTLIEDNLLVSFFKLMEETDISSFFSRDDLIFNQFNRPRLVAYYREISQFQRQIKVGIVHEIYVNTNHPEEYTGYIPKLCLKQLRSILLNT